MPDFYAKTFVRDTGHEKIDSMPDLFKGKMFGVWTTDGEPPTFDGMTPVNFTVDNSIEILLYLCFSISINFCSFI